MFDNTLEGTTYHVGILQKRVSHFGKPHSKVPQMSEKKTENRVSLSDMDLKSIPIFLLAGLCEIGGGYLIWLWLRADKPWWFALVGAIILAFYGVVATWQSADFARVYATYGGIFIVLSIIWAMIFDDFTPDRYDILGGIITLIGVCIIYYAPRS